MDERPLEGGGVPPQPPPYSPAPAAKEKSSRREIVLWMSAALLFLLLLAGLIGGLYAWRFNEVAGELSIKDVDVSGVASGVHAGAYEVFHVKAAVDVEVEGGRIVSIAFTDSGRMSDETLQEIGEIFDEVISSQSLDVDITSGATVSKKVSLKAVEEALGGVEGP